MKFGLRETVFVVLLMVIPLGAWWFVYRPNSLNNASMLKQIEAKRAKLAALNQATGTLGDLKQEISDLQKGVDYLQAKLPSEKEIDKVLREVWMLAEANKLTTKSIRTVNRNAPPDAGAQPFAEQPIDMQLEGDFRGFYAFLQALENQPRIMRVVRMSLRKIEKADEGMMRADVSLSVFFERAKESA
jgi:Tfp pilus assembly protein PilO